MRKTYILMGGGEGDVNGGMERKVVKSYSSCFSCYIVFSIPEVCPTITTVQGLYFPKRYQK